MSLSTIFFDDHSIHHTENYWAAGVAHEIRNPLTSLKGFLQLLYESTDDKFYFDIMLNDLHRIENITSEFLLLAKPQFIDFQPKNIIEIIEKLFLLLLNKQ